VAYDPEQARCSFYGSLREGVTALRRLPHLPTKGTHNTESLIAIRQILDGVANAIFGVVSILVVADRTRATGRFNLVQGSLATAVGLDAALSTTFGGKLIQHFSYRISFLSLGAIAAIAFVLLWMAIPETLPQRHDLYADPSSPAITQELSA
jgi:MFS family permease